MINSVAAAHHAHTGEHARATSDRQSSVCGVRSISAHMMRRRHSSRHAHPFPRRRRSASGIALSAAHGIPVRMSQPMLSSLCGYVAAMSRLCRFPAGNSFSSCTSDVTSCTGEHAARRQRRCHAAANRLATTLPQMTRLPEGRDFRHRAKKTSRRTSVFCKSEIGRFVRETFRAAGIFATEPV